jgi:hypothetical protein
MSSSLVLAMMWGFSFSAYVLEGLYEYLAPLAAVYILIYGYFFIAAPLGRLWDYTPRSG